MAWVCLVASEMLAAYSGIGYRLYEARTLMRSEIALADMLVIGCVGALMNYILGIVQKKITPWQQES
jgi:sulfonate transport system permease protein